MASYVGSIADLMLNSGRLQAQRLIQAANIAAAGQQRIAEIAANSALQQNQNRTGLVNNLAQIVSGSLGDYLQYRAYNNRTKQQDQQVADQHEESLRRRQAFDTAQQNEYQSRRAMQDRPAGGGPGDADFGGGPNDPGGYTPQPAVPMGLPTGGLPDLPGTPSPAGPAGLQSVGLPAPTTGPPAPAQDRSTPYANPSRLDPNRMVRPTREEMIAGQPTNAMAQSLAQRFREVDDHAMKVKEATDKAKKIQDDGLGLLALGAFENGGVDPKTGLVTQRAWNALVDEAEKLGVPKAQLEEYDLQYQADPSQATGLLQRLINRSEPARALRKEREDREDRAKPMPVTPGTDLYDPKSGKWIKNPSEKDAPDYTLGDTRYSGKTNKPLVTNERALALREATAAAQRVTAAAKAGETAASKADTLAMMDGIESGLLPPLLPGRASPQYVALSAEAARRGFDLAGAVTDWVATQKWVATKNNAQQIRLMENINALPELLDSVEALAKQWNAGQFPVLNKAHMLAAIEGTYGNDAAIIANKLKTQIADVVADLGGVYMGGNSPTDHALKLAETALSGDWSAPVLVSMVKQAKQNVRTRRNSINNTGVQGASADNPYAPDTGGTGAPAPLTTPPPAPPGWRYEKNDKGGWTAVEAP